MYSTPVATALLFKDVPQMMRETVTFTMTWRFARPALGRSTLGSAVFKLIVYVQYELAE
jgi:hypothetical protein